MHALVPTNELRWQREANFCGSAPAEICAVGQHVLQTSAARPWRGCLMHRPRCLAELQLCYPDLGEDIESVLSGNARPGCSRPPFGKRGAGLCRPEALGGRRLAVQIKVAMGKKNKCLDSALARSARRRERPIMEVGARGIGSRRLLHEEEEDIAALPRFRLAALRHTVPRVLEILDVASR